MTARINDMALKRLAIRPVNAFAGAAPACLVLVGDGVAVTDQLERESLFGLHGFAPFPPASRWVFLRCGPTRPLSFLTQIDYHIGHQHSSDLALHIHDTEPVKKLGNVIFNDSSRLYNCPSSMSRPPWSIRRFIRDFHSSFNALYAPLPACCAFHFAIT